MPQGITVLYWGYCLGTSVRFNYLVKIQFLGFRYSGWQVQPNGVTLQDRVDRTLKFFLNDIPFKTLAAGRTDAKVSAQEFSFQIMSQRPLVASEVFAGLNQYLPPDIRPIEVKEMSSEFSIMEAVSTKIYHYYLCWHERPHPFSAPFMTYFEGPLNLEIMTQVAQMYEGEHCFKSFCYKPQPNNQFQRQILSCSLKPNTYLSANFLPERSWVFQVSAKGFMRHQVRMMVGVMIKAGLSQISLNEVEAALAGEYTSWDYVVAPPSGLHLYKQEFG